MLISIDTMSTRETRLLVGLPSVTNCWLTVWYALGRGTSTGLILCSASRCMIRVWNSDCCRRLCSTNHRSMRTLRWSRRCGIRRLRPCMYRKSNTKDMTAFPSEERAGIAATAVLAAIPRTGAAFPTGPEAWPVWLSCPTFCYPLWLRSLAFSPAPEYDIYQVPMNSLIS